MYPYLIILAGVLIISPFIIKIAAKQKKQIKTNLKNVCLAIIGLQLLSGFFNWESLAQTGRSGYQLSVEYPQSMLGLFFIISIVQIGLLSFLSQKGAFASLISNFVNSVLIFAGLIRLSGMVGSQLFSYASITAVFLVLIGNVVTLAYVNQDKNLLKKYYR